MIKDFKFHKDNPFLHPLNIYIGTACVPYNRVSKDGPDSWALPGGAVTVNRALATLICKNINAHYPPKDQS
jgi:hypothetical protein